VRSKSQFARFAVDLESNLPSRVHFDANITEAGFDGTNGDLVAKLFEMQDVEL
jgi:hypothetical protein